MHPYSREYFEMMRGKREDHRCKKCSWFGHMAYQCRKKEILEERRKKLSGRGNKFALLLSKVCRRMEGGNVACPSVIPDMKIQQKK